jgi:hypothetical protein
VRIEEQQSDALTNSLVPIETEPIIEPTPMRSRLREALGSKVSRALLAASLLVGTVATIEVAEAPPAAASEVHHVYRTGPDGLWLHNSAGLQTEHVALMPDGSEFDPDCWKVSDAVGGNPVWLHGIYQSPNGPVEGDAADYYVDTSWNTTDDLTNQGISECGTGVSSSEDSSPSSTQEPSTDDQRNYWPAFSTVETSADGDHYATSLRFELTESEVEALQHRAEYLEIDFGLEDTDLPGEWQDYSVVSNIPNAQHDVAFEDAQPTPAVTGIRTVDLQANTPYFAGIAWQMQRPAGTPEVWVDWVPSHWSKWNNLVEAAACGRGLQQPGWCIFGTVRHHLVPRILPIDGHSYILDPAEPYGVVAQ